MKTNHLHFDRAVELFISEKTKIRVVDHLDSIYTVMSKWVTQSSKIRITMYLSSPSRLTIKFIEFISKDNFKLLKSSTS